MRRTRALPGRAALAALQIAALAALVEPHAAQAGINFIGGEVANVAPQPEYLLAGDLTNDGLTDLVVVSPSSREIDVFVADRASPSHLAAAESVHAGNLLRGAALGDLNADGRLDLVITDAGTPAVWVLLGKGDGTFADPYPIAELPAGTPSAVAIGNFHGCGAADLAVADAESARVFILLNDHGTAPQFISAADYEVGFDVSQIIAADFNGDGEDDLATLNLGAPAAKDISILLSQRVTQGVPRFDAALRYTVGERPRDMMVADLNGDGRPDIALLAQGRSADTGGGLEVLTNQGSGAFSAPNTTPVRCPFFTGGAPCGLLTLAGGDFDGNGRLDLAVGLSDPRGRPVGVGPADAMQVFGGRGDGSFVPGPVFAIQKSPVAMQAGTITGSNKVDLAVVAARQLTLQVFANASVPGSILNGTACALGADCLSSQCIDGVCCAEQCGPTERCDIPGRAGGCSPVFPEPIVCSLPEQPECAADQFCVDGYCCDEPCVGGHCNVSGFLGVCIISVFDGQPCSGNDAECSSGFCSRRNLVCCREPCEEGFCDGDGICHALLPNGTPCVEDAECESFVCDEFDLVCCNRRCPADEICSDGVCVEFDLTPIAATATNPTPRLTRAASLASCGGLSECAADFVCIDGVCQPGPQCSSSSTCSAAGNCTATPTASPTITPTPSRLPTLPTPDPCAICPRNVPCDNGLCIDRRPIRDDSGCSVGSGDPAPSAMTLLLPLALWIARRRRAVSVTDWRRNPRH